MTQLEKQQALVSNLRSHTESTVRFNHRSRIPIILTSDESIIDSTWSDNVVIEKEGIIERPKILTEIIEDVKKLNRDLSEDEVIVYLEKYYNEYYIQERDIYVVDTFHYDDRWFSYKYSVDEPQFTFGILKVKNMPYNSFEGKRNKKSFVCSLSDLIYHEYCEPFMVFVGGRFVNWDCIDVVFDCDDTYLLLYGVENNIYNLMIAAANAEETGGISIAILPFKADYLGIEPQLHFDAMYEVTKNYLQDSLRLVNGRPRITVPAVHEVYECRKMVYPVGSWLYTQLKYYKMGILSEDRIKKLKKFEIIKTTKDAAGNVASAYSMKFNALDKDSYKKKLYDKITYGTKEIYKNNAIFKFNSNGKLDDNGENIVALLDENITSVSSFNSNAAHVTYSACHINNILFRENYMIFRGGLFSYRCEPRMSIFNTIGFDNPKEERCDIKTFYHIPIEHIANHTDYFSSVLTSVNAMNIVSKNDDDELSDKEVEQKKYFTDLLHCLDYSYKDTLFYDQNYISGFKTIINYDPILLASLYETNVDSTVLTGAQVNPSLDKSYSYETRKGLKIPRHKYENHESYVMVFVNGVLIEEYSEMIAYPNFFFIPKEDLFDDNDQIELLWFNKIDNNEIEFHMTPEALNYIPESSDPKWRGIDIFNTYIRPENLKVFVKYPEEFLIYHDLVPRNDNIAFNISYRDDGNNDLYLKKEVVDNDIMYWNAGEGAFFFTKEGEGDSAEYSDRCSNTEVNDKTYVAVSSRKFIYQRLYVDQKAYRIILDKRFKYCDNQKQYMLFINGRRIDQDAFLITIPKYNRPFWGMYLYTAKFVKPTDRIELFYLPQEMPDINIEERYSLGIDGYIKFNKTELDVPFDPSLYMFFINGKKIAPINIVSVDSHTVRINKDTLTTDNLIITPLNINIIPEIKTYMRALNKYSDYDSIIKYIKESELLGYDELDMLLNIHVKIYDEGEDKYKSRANVGKIAIINEIVRDFWVTSGYKYNEEPFIYDYEMDAFIYNNEEDKYVPAIPIDHNGNAIIPALDASQLMNIIKNEVRILYFDHVAAPDTVIPSPTSEFYEIGTVLDSITLNWEFTNNIQEYIKNVDEPFDYDYKIRSQLMSYKNMGDKKFTDISIGADDRTWLYLPTPPDKITKDIDFCLTANRGFEIIQALKSIKFVNGIYYGNIDEDALQHYSWIDRIIGLEPKNGILPTYSRQLSEVPKYTAMIYKDFNEVLDDLGYINISSVNDIPIGSGNVDVINNIQALNNNANLNGSTYLEDGFDEYKIPTDLQRMFNKLTPEYKLSPELDLTDYIIGNNNYFVYACPKRLAYSKDNKLLIEFIMPDPRSKEIRAMYREDEATPIYTTGNWNIIDHNLLEPLEVMRMIYLGEFEYTNTSGYTETYCVWRSNGFFTKSFEDYKFHIKVRYKNDAASYDDGLGHIITYDKEITYASTATKVSTQSTVSVRKLKGGSNITTNISDLENTINTTTNTSSIDRASNNIVFLDGLIF